MRLPWFIGCLAVSAALFAFAGGCSDEPGDASAPASAAPPGDGDLVRGLLGGRAPGAAEDRASAKAYDAVVEAVLARLDAREAGFVTRIERELRSHDPTRMVAAKKELDAALGGVAADPTLAERGGLLTQALRPMGEPTQLVTDASQLLCEQPKGQDGQPLHLGRVNGTFGDDRSGIGGAARDTGDLVDPQDWNLLRVLGRVDDGTLVPDPDSRLGAYAATRGYPVGTVGHSVHNAIGTIYVTFANYGQEKIGRVFNSPEARALYNQPVASCAGYQMALLEYQYWSDVRGEDGLSPGGNMGSAFNPTARDLLQRHVFDR
jgi:hypothetical protein